MVHFKNVDLLTIHSELLRW